jgi:hypothetical protein
MVPNNPDSVPISINISLQQLIAVTANIFLTINATPFVDLVGELS